MDVKKNIARAEEVRENMAGAIRALSRGDSNTCVRECEDAIFALQEMIRDQDALLKAPAR
jgi:hypothetical protein